MLCNVIDVCFVKDIFLIYLFSWEIYFGYVGIIYVDEFILVLFCGLYGEIKYLVEILIDYCWCICGLCCVILWFSLVYGLMFDKLKFIFNFFKKVS